jgi:hypothetical protein
MIFAIALFISPSKSINFAYLTQWAARLDLTELMERAIAAAGL